MSLILIIGWLALNHERVRAAAAVEELDFAIEEWTGLDDARLIEVLGEA